MEIHNKIQIRVIIVDDEPLARRKILRVLHEDPEMRVLAECGTGEEAIAMIRQEKPDLVFLDIQMPDMDGFAVLKSLRMPNLPSFIFVTAYDRYALQAFDVHALDYLLKPFDTDRLKEALHRAKTMIRERNNKFLDTRIHGMLTEMNRRPRFLQRILVKNEGRILFLKTDEVDWIEAHSKYMSFYIGGKPHLVRGSAVQYESELDPEKFVRIHRTAIVNIDKITQLQSLTHGDYMVHLKDGTKLTLSRRYWERLHAILQK